MGQKPEIVSLKLEDIRKLVRHAVVPFYQIDRDLPLPVQGHRLENDAEHSWSLAFMAMALAPQIDPALDVGRCCEIALVHDLVEIHAGDTSVWAPDSHHATKDEREEKALKKIKSEFSLFANISEAIEDYKHKTSKEAAFVYALDKLLPLLLLYEDEGYYYREHKKITKPRFDKQFVKHRQKAQSHKIIAKYYDTLMQAFADHPEYFHTPSK